MDDYSIMPFGKYKGAQLINVPDQYLLWLYENGKCFGELKDYIIANLDSIKHNEPKKDWEDNDLNQFTY